MDYDEMSHEAVELSLYMENEEYLVRWVERINALMAKHWVKNDYDKDKGIKGYRNAVDHAAKQYHLEHGTMSTKWSSIFTIKDRDQVAEQLADEFVATVRQPGVWEDLGEQAAKILRKGLFQ